MEPAYLPPLPAFFTIGVRELYNVAKSLRKPLSGYLGGIGSDGYWITKLTEAWRGTFGTKYAIPCNSATSGLLAACMAVGVKPGDTVWTSAYTMSASAACARVLGAHTVSIDIETTRLGMNLSQPQGPLPKCCIVTNLFGHPAYLATMRSWCDSNNVWMIEDNAQAPFASEGGKYAGTIGHIGVFSLNVHKHIQCGEGGVVVSDDGALADSVQRAINHAELYFTKTTETRPEAGLNLRMSEPTAAIACSQLERARPIIQSRITLASALTEMFSGVPWIAPYMSDKNCENVYYVWAARVGGGPWRRDCLVRLLNTRGFPMRLGYSKPLHRIFTPEREQAHWRESPCPVTDRMEDEELITFEVCAYDPNRRLLKQMRDVAHWAIEETRKASDEH